MSPLVLPAAVIVVLAGQTPAKNDAAPTSAAVEADSRLKAIQAASDGYKLYVGSERRKQLVRSPQPVLRFDDAVTLAQQGSVYLWTNGNERPRAIASFYFQADGARVDEFQSLVTGGELAAEWEGAVVWQPKSVSIEFQPLDDGNEIAATKELRLSAMRNIARRFTASVTDRRAGRLELRLLSQPLHRYQDPDGGLVDGAVFAFAKGTNPEVLLLLEAHSDGGPQQWHYALARMSARGCSASYNDHEIWKLTAVGFKQDADQPYFNRYTR